MALKGKTRILNNHEIYDFETERNLLMTISCHKIKSASRLEQFLRTAYASAVCLFLFYGVCAGLYTAVLIAENRTLFLETIHMMILILYALAGICTRLNSNLDGALEMINNGFYTYENENADKMHYEVKEKYIRRIRLVNKWFSRCLISSGSFFIGFTTVKKIIQNKNKLEDAESPINPYLPFPFSLPFDTRSTVGFTVGYLMNIGFMFYIVVVTISIVEIFVSSIEQLRAQFEILNLSITSIEERVYQRFQRETNQPRVSLKLTKRLYQQKEFQDSIFSCLRENARHHQALLRFATIVRSYLQATFLVVAALAVILLAAAVFLISKNELENEEILTVSTFLMMLSTELVFTLQFCFYGEQLSNESGKLFFTLWSTPWWLFDKRAKVLLDIMMQNTKRPLVLKTAGFTFNMSLESYKSIITTAYQIENLVVTMK